MNSKRPKYRNTKTVVDGVTFQSKREASRYGELKIMERAGRIRGLELQPPYDLVVNGTKVARYIADFRYVDCQTGETVVEDVKSPVTRAHPVYRLKAKLLKALLGIAIREV